MKKIAIASLTGLVALGLLAGCTGGNSKSENKKEVKVGVLQYMEHNSLDQARKGFVAELKDAGYEEGKNMTLDYQNAQGDQSNLKSMSERLVKNKNDVILAIATPAAQSVVNETTTLPVLFTAVTDAVSAGLVTSNEKPGGNVTGTSDMVPIDEQTDLLLSIVPEAKTVGIIYNASEKNSEIQSKLAKKALEKSGVKVKEVTVSSTNDVQQVMTSLAKQVDGIYIPTDNTLAKTMSTVGEIAEAAKIPVIAGSTDMVEEGGLATYGINYEKLGRQTGKLAVKILKGEAKPEELSIETSKNLELVVNQKMAKALEIDPASIKIKK
ncbi:MULTISPECIES: ABC transporter substrate-binding protein [Carnobacterium]|uniref:ABC transporter substrate-binding protein n=1 Tax=Carnobacterium TaxID=2747 RepID=UPI0007F55902|nr:MULTISPECIES: ABC transporter substrate-binding protein [Carnobacterium]MCO6017275.1 ABC transporter substrate-binding protein [Carnobacterium divergens]MDT1939310.1 ABC transporter substrate-binding protein [Carnobacterium divergens]MDT1941748.1 ABC transporter substrate-binding protein [Carnobacterium divergens]MDT1947546.1 ABC transporter substrate-binding protein [Carnobacterium divergens]MDT1949985.1 ABC transporter substrate-binding protein [Carnobacterium divergens]